MGFTTLFCYRDNYHTLLGDRESRWESRGSFIRGSGFPLVCRFHRYWAYSSKSTVQPNMESCFQGGACSVCFLLHGHEFEQTPSDREVQRSLACCSPRRRTWLSSWTTPIREGFSGKESICQCRRRRRQWVWSLGWEEREMATHSRIPAWEIPWTEEPGRVQSMGLQS